MANENLDINAVRFNLAMQYITALHHEMYRPIKHPECVMADKKDFDTMYNVFRDKIREIAEDYKHEAAFYIEQPIPEKYHMPEKFRHGLFSFQKKY